MWKVYGLGLRSTPKGLIFQNVTWINSFPENISFVFGADWGFVNDPTTIIKMGLQGNNLYIECLLYEPIDNAPAVSDVLYSDSMKSKGIKQGIQITADCADKYNDTEMVRELKNLGHNIKKVSKAKGVLWSIGLLKKHKIHLIKNEHYLNIKREQENYKWREINGMCINEPVDKYNHIWDACRYCYVSNYVGSGVTISGW